ncbi:MAG: hypothetical protein M3088_02705, partial [Actinomycetota bacterium]|nr:hypothetical protein [Actinomycetota bacterium]
MLTKNFPIDPQPRWRAALAGFDRALGAGAVAEATRRAYRGDLDQLASFACERLGLGPCELGPRELR